MAQGSSGLRGAQGSGLRAQGSGELRAQGSGLRGAQGSGELNKKSPYKLAGAQGGLRGSGLIFSSPKIFRMVRLIAKLSPRRTKQRKPKPKPKAKTQNSTNAIK